MELEEQNAERMKNKINHKKYLEEFEKGYDIITLEKTDIKDIEKYITKVPD